MNVFEALDFIENCGVPRHVLARACDYHQGNWPKKLTSGVMYFEGHRITQKSFLANVSLEQSDA